MHTSTRQQPALTGRIPDNRRTPLGQLADRGTDRPARTPPQDGEFNSSL